MANWELLKAAVAQVIKTNGNEEITGQVLQDVLVSIISNLGAQYSLLGVAEPASVPGAPDGYVAYLASSSGAYTNFDQLTLDKGELALLLWSGSWSKKTLFRRVLTNDSIDAAGGVASFEALNALMLDNEIEVGTKEENWSKATIGVSGGEFGYLVDLKGLLKTIKLYVNALGTVHVNIYDVETKELLKTLDKTFYSIGESYIDINYTLYKSAYVLLNLYDAPGLMMYADNVNADITYEVDSNGAISIAGAPEGRRFFRFSIIMASDIVRTDNVNEYLSDILSRLIGVKDGIASQNTVTSIIQNTPLKTYGFKDFMSADMSSVGTGDNVYWGFKVDKDNYIKTLYLSAGNSGIFSVGIFSLTGTKLYSTDFSVTDTTRTPTPYALNYKTTEDVIIGIYPHSTYILYYADNINGNTIGSYDVLPSNKVEDTTSFRRIFNFYIETSSDIIRSGDLKNYQTKLSYANVNVPTVATPVYVNVNDLTTPDTNDFWAVGTRQTGLTLFMDAYINSGAKELAAYFDENKSVEYPLYGNTGWNGLNDNQNKVETIKNISINDGSVNLPIKLRSIKNSYSKNIKPIVLQIGDSVTEGFVSNLPFTDVPYVPNQSYSWAKYFFMKDKQENNNSGFDSLFVGHKNRVDVNWDGVNGSVFACGQSGWTPYTYFNDVNSPLFKDGASISLKSYLDKYKTLADDGTTRLVVGSSAGSNVSDVNAYDLCTPNIVVIQLGMNGTLADWTTWIPVMINNIKAEYPNMIIIVSVIGGATSFFPSKYPEYAANCFFTDYDNAHSRMNNIAKYAIENVQNETDKIYVLHNGAIQPTPYGVGCRDLINPISKLDFAQSNDHRFVGIDDIDRTKHPNRIAHAQWGYNLYNCIKWIMTY